MNIDADEYLSTLTGRSLSGAGLVEADIRRIQGRIWALLGRQAEAYTLGDSSSVRMETAQELLESMTYVLGISLGTEDGAGFIKTLLDEESYEELFNAGLREVEARVQKGRAMLKEAQDIALTIDNISYHDTLKELSLFFRRYNYRLFAHAIPCSVDYQLCHSVPEDKKGIDYMNEYLRRLIIETKFIRRFEREAVTLLLKGGCPDYREQLINMYEPVAFNALALTLLGGGAQALDITAEERSGLFRPFHTEKAEPAAARLDAAAEQLCAGLGIESEDERAYLKLTAAELRLRLCAAKEPGQLTWMLPSLYREKPGKTLTMRYIDGETMDDELLRGLIDEISGCRFVSDKIEMVKRTVRSLRDYAEILNVCFWGDELTELFKTLGNEELDLLLRYTARKKSKFNDWSSETGWEDALAEYVRKRAD
jgi:hypothetical protein